jgi:hypothetical protein
MYFQTKNPNLGKFRSVLQRKMLVNFMSIWSFSLEWNVFWPFGIFCGQFGIFLVCCTKKNLATLPPQCPGGIQANVGPI